MKRAFRGPKIRLGKDPKAGAAPTGAIPKAAAPDASADSGGHRVSRQMIPAILNVARFPTAEVLDALAWCLGLQLWEFDLLANFEVRGEVPPWWHGAAGGA